MEQFKISVDESHIKDKLVGNVYNKTYYTQRKPNHFMRMYQGFGISKIILDELKKAGVENICIEYLGTKGTIIYNCPLHKFLESKKEWTYKKDDPQLFVSVKDMQIGE